MEKNRILYIGGFQLPDKNAAAHRVLGIAKILRELEYEVVFLDADPDLRGKGVSELHITEGFDTYSRNSVSGVFGLFRHEFSVNAVCETLERYDGWYAVFAYNYPAAALERLRRICRKKQILLIADCTEWYACGKPLRLHGLFVGLDSTLRMKHVQKKLDGVIAISHYLEDYYRERTRTLYLPPLVDLEEEKWSIPVRKPDPNVLELVYAGSTYALKDRLDVIADAVLQSIRNGRKILFHIAGLTEEDCFRMYPDSRDVFEELKGRQSVSFYGRIPHREALALVKRCDYQIFFRYPNRVTMAGFPTKFVESISAATPVLTNALGSITDFADGERNGILFDTDRFGKELTDWLSDEKAVGPAVENSTFDYHSWIVPFRDFIEEGKKAGCQRN